MPSGSSMKAFRYPLGRHPIEGSKHRTIEILYNIPNGIFPVTNIPYSGTTRLAYLEDSTEGNEVLQLLKTAFQRRLTFTVGTSLTTGI